MGTVNTLNGDWQNVSFDDHKRSIRLKDAHAPVNGFRIALVGESGSGKNALADGILHYHTDAISMDSQMN
jgi:ABC-type glutathione transport system ATPase component